LGGINVALGIDSHGMDPVELSGIAAAAPELPDHGTVVALQHPDFIVLAVGREQVSLLRVGPDRDIPHRAVAARILLEEPLLHEAAVLLEDLDAVVNAVADIDKAVIAELHAMHGIGELFWGGRRGIVGRLLVVIGWVAIGAP